MGTPADVFESYEASTVTRAIWGEVHSKIGNYPEMYQESTLPTFKKKLD